MLDLDLTSQSHSSSKPMVPFERAPMTSYSTLMVTGADPEGGSRGGGHTLVGGGTVILGLFVEPTFLEV